MIKGPLPLFRPYQGFTLEITLTTDTEAGRTFTLPTVNVGTFNYLVNWGDGTSNTITTFDSANRIHIYATTGRKVIEIRGECPSMRVFSDADKPKVTNILYWGDSAVFGGFRDLGSSDNTGLFFNCVNLKSTGKGKIIAKAELTKLIGLFRGCNNVSFTTITPNLFDNCTELAALGFLSIFRDCSNLTSIPNNIFNKNTKLSTDAFTNAFYNCTNLSGFIPLGLFDNNLLVTSFAFMFFNCSNLEFIPINLFRNNIAVTSFRGCFQNCNKIQINKNIFYADGEQGTRFLNKTVSFQNTFSRNSFTGVQGTAPDLWVCNFGTGTPTKTNCFSGNGNSLTSLTNYTDIPSDWII